MVMNLLVYRENAPDVGGRVSTIGHTCDTNPGNSGSPILNRKTGEVIGLHFYGGAMSTDDRDYYSSYQEFLRTRKDILTPENFADEYRKFVDEVVEEMRESYNRAVKTSAIVEFLQKSNIELAEELFVL
jgi:V8-like Glu-specific endopeptidase